MATNPKRTIGYVSIGIIVVFWLSEFRFFGATSDPSLLSLPEAFWRVVIRNTIIIGLIVSLMRLEGDSCAGVGLSRKSLGKQFLVGAALGLLMFLFGQIIVANIVGALVPGSAPVTITRWFQDLSYIPLWFVMAVYGGGIGEELTRVFVLTRFEKMWGRTGIAIALFVHAAAFGSAHLYQGTQVAIGVGISSLAYSLIFLRRRSALELMMAHLTFDIIAITLGFLIYYKG